jgi:hypothetical protein
MCGCVEDLLCGSGASITVESVRVKLEARAARPRCRPAAVPLAQLRQLCPHTVHLHLHSLLHSPHHHLLYARGNLSQRRITPRPAALCLHSDSTAVRSAHTATSTSHPNVARDTRLPTHASFPLRPFDLRSRVSLPFSLPPSNACCCLTSTTSSPPLPCRPCPLLLLLCPSLSAPPPPPPHHHGCLQFVVQPVA